MANKEVDQIKNQLINFNKEEENKNQRERSEREEKENIKRSKILDEIKEKKAILETYNIKEIFKEIIDSHLLPGDRGHIHESDNSKPDLHYTGKNEVYIALRFNLHGHGDGSYDYAETFSEDEIRATAKDEKIFISGKNSIEVKEDNLASAIFEAIKDPGRY